MPNNQSEESFRNVTIHFQKSGKLFRIMGFIVVISAVNYFVWRYTQSLNTNALWFAIPLLIAETYGFIDLCFFLMIIWHPVRRTTPDWEEKPTVDIFITTYNETADLLDKTVRAAVKIDWPHKNVFILDDGNRQEIRRLAEQYQCGYIIRGTEWNKKPRYAKAGNINNALLQTSGEFILILDADQIPAPQILKKTIGYFKDEKVAFVQTPQFFYNIPKFDPFGSDASLFYGPIMQGKDSWNAAFFCGSNAVLRRESLMQIGLIRYVQNTHYRMKQNIRQLQRELKQLPLSGKKEKLAIRELLLETKKTLRMLKTGEPFESCSDYLNAKITAALTTVSGSGFNDMFSILDEMAKSGDQNVREVLPDIRQSLSAIQALGHDSNILDLSGNVLAEINLQSPSEALPVQPLVTESITEDMATALLLHSNGWKSVYHPEILARGLAPEDLRSSLNQRYRWAKGTIQVLRKEHPFKIPGLTLGQRLMYFNTIWSYFSGFFNIILILSPLIFLFFNIAPIKNWSMLFFVNFVPFFLLNKMLFRVVSKGIPIWRGEQYSVSLFPLWIKAVFSVYAGIRSAFTVTPKTRQSGTYFRLVIPQFVLAVLTAAAIIFYILYWLISGRGSLIGFGVNAFWGIYNIALLSGIIHASFYDPDKNKERSSV
ncbi:MAG: glycosyltransferase [Treponema sp.]|nr:glycosyltransferase [Treponema sp.]